MEWTQLRGAVAAGAILALPASAQDGPIVPAPPMGRIVPPDAAPMAPRLATGSAPIDPDQPGLSRWRRRHLLRKRHLQESFIGYPEEFNEWPLGGALYAHGRTMVANGATARLILNHYDFVGDTAALNVRGQDKLRAIAAGLPASFDPVIVERTPWAPGVDEARRLAVLGQLAAGPFPVPAERVLIGPALPSGMRGTEGVIVSATMLNNTANGGISLGGSQGLSAAAVGQGVFGRSAEGR